MLGYLFAILIAAALVVCQASVLSHLPAFFASISLIIAAICVAIVAGRDLEAAAIALCGGILLDLHGIFGFGAELAAAFAAFAVMRLLFSRFLSNASLLAVFLLAALGVLTHFAVLAGIDGLRVLFGREPYLLVFESNILTGPLLSMLTTGLVSVAAVAIGRAAERLSKRIFLSRSLILKL